MNDPTNPVLQELLVEVNQEAQPEPREAQVRQELGLVDRIDPFHGLELDDHQPADDEVEAVTILNCQLLVLQR